jgi:hypothetical protein
MNLTTLQTLKLMNEQLASGSSDPLLSFFIRSTSAEFEAYLARGIEVKERTELFNVRKGDVSFALSSYPVTAMGSVKNAGLTISSDSIHTSETGIVYVSDYDLFSGFGELEVVYTGGMATDTEDFVTKYPDIEKAIVMQISFEFTKKDNLVDKSIAIGNQIASRESLDLLPAVKKILDRHRNKARHV